MALKFVLKQSKATLGPHAGKIVYSAQPAAQEEISFASLCRRIAEQSAMTSADVKAVLDRLAHIMGEELPNGKTIRVGELGSFRLSFGSKQVLKPEEFTTDLIKGHRLVYAPAKGIKDIPARGQLKSGSSSQAFTYERVEAQPKKKDTKPNAGGESGGNTGDNTGGTGDTPTTGI